ncbi:LOW QUALITY PROTEIN: rhamnulokinase [Geomicrobium sp. JCM 19037]|nr:LOW QUALITY PROTEIN: rhamnulokinase [Geomicrobium sp. JCM 19037]
MKAIAIDIGASSGRVIVGYLERGTFKLEEIHRFLNNPVRPCQTMHWDILRLLYEVKRGLGKVRLQGHDDASSIGIDTWAVDYGLLDEDGELISNPVHYRDHRTDGMVEEVSKVMTREAIYERTGIQFMTINTLIQWYALKKGNGFKDAKMMLMIPDLLRYFISGNKVTEVSNASTTQFFNANRREWDIELLRNSISHIIYCHLLVEAGNRVGTIKESLAKELNLPEMDVVAVGEHDTASAVAAIPTREESFAFLSCGTWSLLGTELSSPCITEEAFRENFTNEAGVYGTTRFLKNIMGLWIVQRCMEEWSQHDEPLTYEEMGEAIDSTKPFVSFINPDEDRFLSPSSMIEEVRAYCVETEQYIPKTKGEILRCILESLSFKYRFTMERMEAITGRTNRCLYLVGGGSKNQWLCQFTANAINRPVVAGPTEATALGNIVVQLIAGKHVSDLKTAREMIANSVSIKTYDANYLSGLERSYERFVSHLSITAN